MPGWLAFYLGFTEKRIEMKTKVNRVPYFICIAASGLQLGVVFSWSYFRDSLATLFPTWTAARLSLVFSMHNVTVVVTALITGVLLKYLKQRTLVAMAGAVVLIGFGVFPLFPLDNPGAAYIMLFISFGVVAASSSGFAGISVPTVYQPWFPDHLGLLTGVLFMASGLSPIIFGYICSLLIPAVGVLRAVQILGAIMFVIIVATLPWCKTPGPDVKLPPPKITENSSNTRDYTLKEVLRNPLYWCFFLYTAMARSVGIVLLDLGGTIAVAFGVATLLGLIISPANGAASVIGGIIQDRIGIGRTILLSCGMLVLSSLLLISGSIADSAFAIITALIIGGLGYGVSLVISASATRILFGDKHYAQNYSFLTVSLVPAAASGYLAGALLDRIGNYSGVFIMVLILCILSLVCGLILVRSKEMSSR